MYNIKIYLSPRKHKQIITKLEKLFKKKLSLMIIFMNSKIYIYKENCNLLNDEQRYNSLMKRLCVLINICYIANITYILEQFEFMNINNSSVYNCIKLLFFCLFV